MHKHLINVAKRWTDVVLDLAVLLVETDLQSEVQKRLKISLIYQTVSCP